MMSRTDKVLDFLLREKGTSFQDVENEVNKAERDEREARKEARAEAYRMVQEQRKKSAYEAMEKTLYGKRVFVRIGKDVIPRLKNLKCPNCRGDIPQIVEDLADAWEASESAYLDLGDRPWIKNSHSCPCSKCHAKHDIMTVLL